MKETPVRALEVVPPTGDAPEEEVREQTEWGEGLRKASEAVSLVCAGVLAGVALGAINPFVLGISGVALGGRRAGPPQGRLEGRTEAVVA